MFLSPIRFLILLLLFNFVVSGQVLRKIKERVRELQLQKAKQSLLTSTVSGKQPVEHVKEGKINQPLDHFNRQVIKTFPQRFFVNDAFWQRPHGPVFLFIGGEGPIFEFDVLAGHHVEMAVEYGALLLALEHRFYGNSINPDGLETENLAYLSSQQALSDLAVFHQHISQRFSLTHRNTWISFGGSYSGALSAWFRGKGAVTEQTTFVPEDFWGRNLPPYREAGKQFPHLVFGAVASSAPVKAILDFSAYNKIVSSSLTNEAVGGSDKCLANVQEAFATVEAALMGDNAGKVAKDFGCCQIPKNLDDQTELMENLAGIVMGTVQYNEEWAGLSINKICDVMTNKSEAYEEEMDAYKRLVQLAQIYRSISKEACLNVSHEHSVNTLFDTSLKSARKGERQWLYQTCTEFGFYQTCEDSSCPFSGMLTLRDKTKLCSLVFGISPYSLPGRIAFTNTYYGADDPHTHRVLYVNGGVDPWQELSVLDNRTTAEGGDRTIFIKDTAHCADMMPDRAVDRSSLQRARREIEKHVAEWLKAAAWETTEKLMV